MTIFLAHGASGSAATMRPYVDALTALGFSARTVPRTGRLSLKFESAQVTFRKTVGALEEAVIGGHSYGGRVASLLAAVSAPRGLVLLSYPLHPPGRPEGQRTAHLSAIQCPVLFLSGESDPFARIDLLREAVKLVPHAQLVTYPGVGHGLRNTRTAFEDAIWRLGAFVRSLESKRRDGGGARTSMSAVKSG
jgi:predicted alpha/beta-hydrolase family hydrolase